MTSVQLACCCPTIAVSSIHLIAPKPLLAFYLHILKSLFDKFSVYEDLFVERVPIFLGT